MQIVIKFVWICSLIIIANLHNQQSNAQIRKAALPSQPQLPSPKPESPYAKYRVAANENVVRIMSGNSDGGSLHTIYDIATVLGRKSNIRVIPVAGHGSVQNVKDVLYLDGIDMAIIQPHVLQYFKTIGEAGLNIEERIAYITTLFTDELHVFSRRSVRNFQDLAGRRVNFSNEGSGTQISMRLIFKALGMKVKEYNMGQADAFELMKKGELDATVCTCTRPLKNARMLGKNSENFKLLSVPYPVELEETFFPGLLLHKDYPQLIPAGDRVNTVAVQTILGVYNWQAKETGRYQLVARFIDAFFNNIKEFHKPPRQAKWWSVNIAARVSDLKRFAPAQEWLNRHASSIRFKAGSHNLDNGQIITKDNIVKTTIQPRSKQ